MTLRMRIERDEDPLNPRTEFDHLGTIVICGSHTRRYSTGDENHGEDLNDHLNSEAEWLDDRHEARIDKMFTAHPYASISLSVQSREAAQLAESWFDARRDAALKVLERHWIVLPVRADSGGYSNAIYVSDWDNANGYIYVTNENARKDNLVKRLAKKVRQNVENVLRGEIDEYNQYLTGDVYGFIIEDVEPGVEDDDIDTGGETIDSSWGFYGEDYCREEGERALEYAKTHAETVVAIGETVFI